MGRACHNAELWLKVPVSPQVVTGANFGLADPVKSLQATSCRRRANTRLCRMGSQIAPVVAEGGKEYTNCRAISLVGRAADARSSCTGRLARHFLMLVFNRVLSNLGPGLGRAGQGFGA